MANSKMSLSKLIIERLKTWVAFPIRNVFLELNYRLGAFKEVVWLIGDGRSGTTWVANLVNHQKKMREMFEPFHPVEIENINQFQPFLYLRENQKNTELEAFYESVFSGKFKHRRVDFDNRKLLYKGLLVKDIYSNLLAFWAVHRFPFIKPVLLMRNPFAVAASKLQKQNWYWPNEPLSFLSQKDLIEDFLLPYEPLIKEVASKNDFFLNQILNWCIINYVPLKQFSPNQLKIVFYEDMYTSPQEEISHVFTYLNVTDTQSNPTPLKAGVVDKPSRVVGKSSNIVSGTSPITSWQKELTSEQKSEAAKILTKFNMHDFYSDESLPNKDRVQRFMMKTGSQYISPRV